MNEARVQVRSDSITFALSIEDSGRGFDSSALAAGASTGISAMRERAGLLGGKLRVESAPGAGTKIIAELPILEATPKT